MNLSNPLGAAPIGGLSSAKPAAPKRFLPRFSEHPDARLPTWSRATGKGTASAVPKTRIHDWGFSPPGQLKCDQARGK
jgi:hypothetical protein